MENSPAVSETTRKDLEVLVSAGVLERFYLAGGTALAFLLQHRESQDLDFFREDAFNENTLAGSLDAAGDFSLEKKEVGTVRGMFNKTLVSFFHYPYPLLEEPEVRGGMRLASILDISCMKLDALASRGARRDFIDLYFILQQPKLSLTGLLELFAKKYASLNFNLLHIKKSLVHFTDAEQEPMPRMIKPAPWPKVKDFFIQELGNLHKTDASCSFGILCTTAKPPGRALWPRRRRNL